MDSSRVLNTEDIQMTVNSQKNQLKESLYLLGLYA